MYDVSQNWYRASVAAIEYMMDPRQSFSEQWIFQFQDLTSTDATYDQIYKMTEGSFLNSEVDNIITIAKEEGVNPFHLIARIFQEQGKDGSGIMNGYNYNGTKVYNLFNIYVSGNDSSGITAGAEYACSQGWYSIKDSIRGGAQFLKQEYFNKGQTTLYFEKYNVVDTTNLYNNQYMQNIRAANDEGNVIYQEYDKSGILNSNFVFVIPVYEGMPQQPCERP